MDTIDEGLDEEEDPDLDIPILDLVVREKGNTLLDTMSTDTSDPINTSDTEPETATSEESTSATTLLNFSPKVSGDCHDLYRDTVNVVFTQMSAAQGIKKHGEKAIAAIFKELKYFNDGAMPGKPVVGPIPFTDLTEKDRSEVLEAVNLIKEKRCGKLKGCTCANGS